jgi:hypothetical protein
MGEARAHEKHRTYSTQRFQIHALKTSKGDWPIGPTSCSRMLGWSLLHDALQ